MRLFRVILIISLVLGLIVFGKVAFAQESTGQLEITLEQLVVISPASVHIRGLGMEAWNYEEVRLEVALSNNSNQSWEVKIPKGQIFDSSDSAYPDLILHHDHYIPVAAEQELREQLFVYDLEHKSPTNVGVNYFVDQVTERTDLLEVIDNINKEPPKLESQFALWIQYNRWTFDDLVSQYEDGQTNLGGLRREVERLLPPKSPIPAWILSTAIVASSLVLFVLLITPIIVNPDLGADQAAATETTTSPPLNEELPTDDESEGQEPVSANNGTG